MIESFLLFRQFVRFAQLKRPKRSNDVCSVQFCGGLRLSLALTRSFRFFFFVCVGRREYYLLPNERNVNIAMKKERSASNVKCFVIIDLDWELCTISAARASKEKKEYSNVCESNFFFSSVGLASFALAGCARPESRAQAPHTNMQNQFSNIHKNMVL